MLINNESNYLLEVLNNIAATMPDYSEGDTIHALIARDSTVLASWLERDNLKVETSDETIINIINQQFSSVLDTVAPGFEFDISEVKYNSSDKDSLKVMTTPWRRIEVSVSKGSSRFRFKGKTARRKEAVFKSWEKLSYACMLIFALVIFPLVGFSRPAQPIVIAQPDPVVVYVKGYVMKPGVYKMPGDSNIADAINAAGGPGLNADLEKVSMSKAITDCEEIIIPSKNNVQVK
ncbi:SLBB domain-containing protein [Dendrosporobacter sp. 1207_IL3150]|uniref:SLBB domain-containing protein n=1 Tax=Dendrosporobacter sp. 1207_IL3150 TaxID=3084054 RepID=UPI002FDB1C54